MKRSVIFILLAVVGFVGCQTTSTTPPEGAVLVGTVIPFNPSNPQAAIQLESGRYPDLLANDSYAFWVDEDVSLARREEARELGEVPDAESLSDAMILDMAYHVFELHLNSKFADGSIAYDVVGLRGVDVYLETVDGLTIRPVRTATGDLQEGREGALLSFSRTVLLGFPSDVLQLTLNADEAQSTSLRLVIEGHGTKYYFEWFPELPEVYFDSRALQRRQIKAAKMRYDTYYDTLRQWAHTFD